MRYFANPEWTGRAQHWQQHHPLFCHGVSGVVEDFLDLRQGDLLRIVGEMNGLRRDINRDAAHPCQFPNRSFNGMLAMFTRNVWSDKSCSFHGVFPPFMPLTWFSAISSDGVELDQFLNDCFLTITFNTFRDTGLQVSFQDNRFQFLQGFAYRIGLA